MSTSGIGSGGASFRSRIAAASDSRRPARPIVSANAETRPRARREARRGALDEPPPYSRPCSAGDADRGGSPRSPPETRVVRALEAPESACRSGSCRASTHFRRRRCREPVVDARQPCVELGGIRRRIRRRLSRVAVDDAASIGGSAAPRSASRARVAPRAAGASRAASVSAASSSLTSRLSPRGARYRRDTRRPASALHRERLAIELHHAARRGAVALADEEHAAAPVDLHHVEGARRLREHAAAR